jgi:catechol 2,3-dioxygenase-like lactoylglutathione lyase family enzyme
MTDSILPQVPPLCASLHHLVIGSPDPQALAEFYGNAMDMTVGHRDGAWHATGPDRRLLFTQGQAKSLSLVAYAVPDPLHLAAIRQRCAALDVAVAPWTSDMLEPGAVCVIDPDGNRIVFGIAVADSKVDRGLKARLQHVVVASTDAQRLSEFYQAAFGFVLSDDVVDDQGELRTAFLRCSEEHHSFAVFQAASCWFDHHCYEVGDWGLIRDWGDHFARFDIPAQWGPGRHGPGNNLFLFVHDRDGNWLEVSAELEIVTPDRPVGVWKHEQRTLNSWGTAPLRS